MPSRLAGRDAQGEEHADEDSDVGSGEPLDLQGRCVVRSRRLGQERTEGLEVSSRGEVDVGADARRQRRRLHDGDERAGLVLAEHVDRRRDGAFVTDVQRGVDEERHAVAVGPEGVGADTGVGEVVEGDAAGGDDGASEVEVAVGDSCGVECDEG